MLSFWTDLIYLAVCETSALAVGWTLHKNGRVFLMEIFQGKEDLADSVNHLILVGFYLMSLGFVTLAINVRTGAAPVDMAGVIEALSTKVGVVLFVLGATHFLNLLMFSRMRWRVRLVLPEDNSGISGRPTIFSRAGGEAPPVAPEEPSPRGPGRDPREL